MYTPNLYYPIQVRRSICVHYEHNIIREYAEKIKISAGYSVTAFVVRLAITKECAGGNVKLTKTIWQKKYATRITVVSGLDVK